MEKVDFVVDAQVWQCCVHMLLQNLEVFRWVTSSWRRRHEMGFCFSEYRVSYSRLVEQMV